MPKSVGEFIFDLAKKAGVPEDDAGLTAFAQDKDFFNKAFPESLDTGIDNQLVSLKDAKNNHPEIRNFYHKKVLSGIDNAVAEILETSDLPDLEKSAILNEPSSYKKVPLLVQSIQDHISKKHTAGKPDKDGLQKQIDDLQKLLAGKDEQVRQKEKESSEKIKGLQIEYKLDSMLGGYKTTLDTLDPEVRSATIKQLINKHLQDNEAQFSFDDNGKFVLIKKDGTNYYGENHQLIEPKAFLERTLSQSKLLKVSDQPPVGEQRQATSPPVGGSGRQEKSTTLSALVQNSIKNLETNGAIQVMG